MGTDNGGKGAAKPGAGAASPLARAVPNAPATTAKQIVSVTKRFFPICAILGCQGHFAPVYGKLLQPPTKFCGESSKKEGKIFRFNLNEKKVTLFQKK